MNGRIDTPTVWWSLHLDSGTIISTASARVDPGNTAAQWRDHSTVATGSSCVSEST